MSSGSKPSIAVLGIWHQGAVAAACLADAGFDVMGADPDAETVAKLNAGKAPLFEPGLDELIQSGLHSGRLRFTTDYSAAVRGRPFVFVMFDTPVDEQDRSDLSGVFEACRAVAGSLVKDATLWVTAQVPVGTCDRLVETIRQANPSATFGLAYSPENLRLGQALALFRSPALPVMGADSTETLDRLERVLSVFPVKWQRVSLRTAEMTKHALNGFLAACITFGNELGNLCDEVGADGRRVAEVLRQEPRVGPRAMLFPGLGFSGGTLARDVQALRALGDAHRLETHFLDGVWQANQAQNRLVLRKLKAALGNLAGRRVAVLGLTYKPDTSTLRRSAALEIIGDLAGAGAVVRAHDPKADREELQRCAGFEFVDDVYTCAEQADAVVLITPWSEYRDLDVRRLRERMSGSVFIDTQNLFDGDALTQAGFLYLDVGRGRSART